MRSRLSTFGVIVTVVLGLCGVSACSKAPSMTDAQRKSIYLTTGNTFCDQGRAAVLKLIAIQKPHVADVDSEASFVELTLTPKLRQIVQTLASIPPPPGDGSYVTSIYQDYGTALDIWKQYPLGTEADGPRHDVDGRLVAYGLTHCAKLTSPFAGAATTTSTTAVSTG